MQTRVLRRLALLVYLLLILAMGAATFVEQARGAGFAALQVYHTAWFSGLWCLLALLGVWLVVRARLWRRLPVLLLHLALLLILVGAGVTHFQGVKGTVSLRDDTPVRLFSADGDARVRQLPFTLRLDSFRVEHYAGTQTPSDFVSYVRVGDGPQQRVSMNHILNHRGWRFYQSSFDADGHGSTLMVSHDPWGISLTYFGYALLALAMVWTLLGRRERFRQLLSDPLLRRTFVVALLMAPSVLAARSLPTVGREQADSVARMQVVCNGRVAPLNTLAVGFVQKVYGRSSYKGLTAEQVLLGWAARPDVWQGEQMIRIKDARLRRQLGVFGDYASLSQLFSGQTYRLDGMEPTKAVRELDEQVGLILMLTGGTLVEAAPADVRLSPSRVEAEIFYNAVPFTKVLFMACLTLGLLLFVYVLVRLLHPLRRDPVLAAGRVLLGVALGVCAVSYVLRWYVGGRVPLGNGSETMQFMALCLLALAFAARRYAYAVPFGFLLAGFALLVSWLGERSPQITHLMPVLSSPLLSAHVGAVMVAYALLAFLAVNGIFALLVRPRGINERSADVFAQVTLLSRLLLYPAVFLLAVGIFLGAVWANVSWGTYWSWDPKEVWALITLLLYALPLHDRGFTAFRRPLWLHVYLVAAFFSVLMTYFGVNYFLGGMHSYA